MRIRDLRSLRLEKGLSIEQLARLAGTTAATISRIENGILHPKYELADRIAAALGVPVEIVFPRFAKRLSPKLEDTTKAKV